jgi:hypothetical protein
MIYSINLPFSGIFYTTGWDILPSCLLVYLTNQFQFAIIRQESKGGAMNTQAQRIKISVDVSEKERIYIKMIAAKRKMTISEFVMSFVRPNLPHSEPNEETIRVFKDTDEGKNLIHYKNADDLINKLDLK